MPERPGSSFSLSHMETSVKNAQTYYCVQVEFVTSSSMSPLPIQHPNPTYYQEQALIHTHKLLS